MELSGQTITLRLSAKGLKELAGLLMGRPERSRALPVFVLDTDSSGLWIANRRFEDERIEVLLIRWQVIDTIVFAVDFGEHEGRPAMGFR